MTKIQNSKKALVFEYWNLGFTWNLVLGICYFAMLHYSLENSLPVCSNYLQYDLLPGTGCLCQSIQHPHIANTLLRGQSQFRLSQNRIGEMFHHE